jgi:transcriptional regulator with XRE-family HTH domain
MAAPSADYSPQLQTLMGAVGLTSYRALGRAAGVSRTAVDRLRRGQVGGLSVQTLLHLSQALQVSSAELIAQFSWPVDPPPRPHRQSSPVSDLAIDSEAAQRQRFQADALACLEPWLRQWPTAVAATQRQPDLPASRLLPLTQPWQDLLQSWGVTAIGEVGIELPYDPQIHQPLQGTVAPGARVRVRYLGYRHGDRLLYRAQVSPVP